jgi:hypothetical protein
MSIGSELSGVPAFVSPSIPSWLHESVTSKTKPILKQFNDYSIAFYQRLNGSVSNPSDAYAAAVDGKKKIDNSQPAQLKLTLVKESVAPPIITIKASAKSNTTRTDSETTIAASIKTPTGFSIDDRKFRVAGTVQIGTEHFTVVQGEAIPAPFLGFYTSSILYNYTLLLRPISSDSNVHPFISVHHASSKTATAPNQPIYTSDQLYVLYAEVTVDSSLNPFTQYSNVRTLHLTLYKASAVEDTKKPKIAATSSATSSATASGTTYTVKLEPTLAGTVSAKFIEYVFDQVLGIQSSQWKYIIDAFIYLVLFQWWILRSISSVFFREWANYFTSQTGSVSCSGKYYKNWDGDVRIPLATKNNFFVADTVDQLKTFIGNNSKASIRILGSGHSFNENILRPLETPAVVPLTGGVPTHLSTPTASPTSFLISTDKLNSIISIDLQTKIVTVEGGVQLRRLAETLHDRGLTIPNHGAYLVQTVAGAISTGTHGTSGKWVQRADGTYEDDAGTAGLWRSILEVSVVDEKGNTRVFTNPSEITSLGLVGVITAVKIQAVPVYYLQQQQTLVPLEFLQGQLGDFVQQYPFVEVRGATGDKFAALYTYSSLPNVPRFLAPYNFIYRFGLRIAYASISPLTPAWFYRLTYRGLTVLSQIFPFRDVNTWAITKDYAPPHTETEWAIPFERTQDALTLLFQLLNGEVDNTNYRDLIGEFHVRFDLPAAASLSPAYGRHTTYIDLNFPRSGNSAKKVQQLLSAFQKQLITLVDANRNPISRPHWSKQFYTDDTEYNPAYFKSVYPQFDQFKKWVQDQSPQGVFSYNRFAISTGLVPSTRKN